MQITALGLSCDLLAFEHPSGTATRILVDPWLSDHATGDAMGRFPRLRFELEALGTIDAVYLSHAHSDHLDPYTLVRLWKELEHPPVLLIPVTLSFLLPIFRIHLPNLRVVPLQAHLPLVFRGIELLGFYDVGTEATNEDDVMVLVVTHRNERVLVEADARENLGELVFKTMIPRNVRISEAPSYALPVLSYDSASKGSEAYRALSLEIATRYGLTSQRDEDKA